MARRKIGGAEGRRIEKENKRFDKRVKNTRDEFKMVIIACEDSKSSRFYFQAIFDELIKSRSIAKSSLVIAKHKNTHPTGVLQDLLDHLGWQDFDHQWIVIDRDEERSNSGGHSLEDFNEAINKANSKNVKVVYSNPCFEIWVLLHFEYRNIAMDRDELNKLLKQKYQYTKKALFSIILNSQLQAIAIKNAEYLLQSWINSQGKLIPATDNPSTTVHKLIHLLNDFRKTNN